jgi:hypothetical protein
MAQSWVVGELMSPKRGLLERIGWSDKFVGAFGVHAVVTPHGDVA